MQDVVDTGILKSKPGNSQEICSFSVIRCAEGIAGKNH